jgi:uncharacterized protein
VEHENGQLRAFEFKWSESKARLPVAFAKTYPEASFTVISQENYLEFVTKP